MPDRWVTIRQLDDAGMEIRAWCFACARGGVIGSGIWKKFSNHDLTLIEARARFPCKMCRSSADVLLLPATAEMVTVKPMSWADEVASFFHASRSARKRRR